MCYGFCEKNEIYMAGLYSYINAATHNKNSKTAASSSIQQKSTKTMNWIEITSISAMHIIIECVAAYIRMCRWSISLVTHSHIPYPRAPTNELALYQYGAKMLAYFITISYCSRCRQSGGNNNARTHTYLFRNWLENIIYLLTCLFSAILFIYRFFALANMCVNIFIFRRNILVFLSFFFQPLMLMHQFPSDYIYTAVNPPVYSKWNKKNIYKNNINFSVFCKKKKVIGRFSRFRSIVDEVFHFGLFLSFSSDFYCIFIRR